MNPQGSDPRPPAAAPPVRSRLEQLSDLGRLGAVVHFAGYLACLAVCCVLVELGFREEVHTAIGAAERIARAHVSTWLADKLSMARAEDGGVTLLGLNLATLGSAYVVTKVLSVPRILLTLAVTPAIARRLERASETPTP